MNLYIVYSCCRKNRFSLWRSRECDDCIMEKLNEKELESIIIGVWSRVLKVPCENISIHDEFTSVGGDSLKSMSVYAKLAKLGIRYPTKKFLEHGTVAGLVSIWSFDQNDAQYDQHSLSGSIERILPAQSWFLSERFATANQFNVSIVFDSVGQINYTALRRAYSEVVYRHDSLRQSFFLKDDEWRSTVSDFDDSINALTMYSLKNISGPEVDFEYSSICDHVHEELSLDAGSLSKLVCIEMPIGVPDRILFIVHHLAADGYSFNIICQDLLVYYNEFYEFNKLNLNMVPPKTANVDVVSKKFFEYMSTSEAENGKRFWLSMPWLDCPNIALDNPISGSNNTVNSKVEISFLFDEQETKELMVTDDSRLSIQEKLLWGLHEALTDFNKSNVSKILTVDSGRSFSMNELGVDVSRTATWLAITPPVILLGKSLRTDEIKKQIRECKRYGPFYEIATWMCDNTFDLPKIPDSEKVVLNYLGSEIDEDEGHLLVRRKNHYRGKGCNIAQDRACIFFISSKLIDNKLEIVWEYSDQLHSSKVVKTLLRDMVNHIQCLSV